MKYASVLLVVATILSTSSFAQVLKEEPLAGALRGGIKVFVDDGTCPEGQIKEITGANPATRTRQTRRCVSSQTPPPQSSIPVGPVCELAALKPCVEKIRSDQ